MEAMENEAREKSLVNFMEIVRMRRSFRKFSDKPLELEKVEYLKKVLSESAQAFGFVDLSFVFVLEDGLRKRLARAIFSGLLGKVNPWVLTTKAPVFFVACGCPESKNSSEVSSRPIYLAESAILMEIMILAATEIGLASCWLGGFGEDGVKKALEIPEEVRVIAISPIGYPPEKIGVTSWDYMARNLVSKRRVPLEKIVTEI